MTDNYTPIKRTKKNAKILDKIDGMINSFPLLTRVCLPKSEYDLLRDTMSQETKDYFRMEIPYRGVMIYHPGGKFEGAEGHLCTVDDLEKWE
jgi:hypothetical protein